MKAMKLISTPINKLPSLAIVIVTKKNQKTKNQRHLLI